MYKKQISIILSLVTMVLVSACNTTGSAPATSQVSPSHAKPGSPKPLKVYILAGQSNMQGKAAPFTIPRMALSPESKELHDKILDKDGEPREYKNVSIVYFTGGDEKRGEKRPLQEMKGLLAAGVTGGIGPELGFGITMDEAVDEPILIIKTAWGGKSLYRNFRPPSAGLMPFERPQSGGRRKKQPPSAEELKEMEKEHNASQGVYYRLMMKLIKGVLDDPGKYSDAYDPKQGYEIAGFGWFQGFNDMIAGKATWYKATEDRPQFAEYSDLLAHFIRDVRKDLKAPKMPFVIGVVGIGGSKTADPFREAMAAPASMPEFKGNVAAVETGRFWDNEMLEAVEKVSKSNGLWDNSEHWTVVGQPEPKDRIWSYTSFDLDEDKQYRQLEKGEKGDIRTLTGDTPGKLKDWLNPDFDTSKWQKGPAPIINGEVPRRKGKKTDKEEEKTVETIGSPWGDGNVLLAKTTFTLDRTDIAAFRLCIQCTSSFHAYLNGHRIKDYPWWKGDNIRKFDIDAACVKQGLNELEFYGNLHGGDNTYNAVDLYLEGLPKTAAAEIQKQQAATATPRDHALARGKSNQSYHYMGSAYTYSLIGEALAKAVIGMEKAAEK